MPTNNLSVPGIVGIAILVIMRTFKDPVFKPCLRTLKPEKSGQLS